VTRKTVEAHLGAVFRKLDVAGRADLPAALTTSGAGEAR
jgi:DNA-binding CsgD family transcriptional regulator